MRKITKKEEEEKIKKILLKELNLNNNTTGLKICVTCKKEKQLYEFDMVDLINKYKNQCKTCCYIPPKKEGYKYCPQCKIEKVINEFGYNSRNKKDGCMSTCKSCRGTKKPRNINYKVFIDPINNKYYKICPKCDNKKELNEYHKSKYRKDGHSFECKLCKNTGAKKRNEENKLKPKAPKIYISISSKICTRCGIVKDINDFGNNKNTRDGKECGCKNCRVVSDKERRNSPEGKMKEKEYRDRPEIILTRKQYKIDNKEKIDQQNKEYREREDRKEFRRNWHSSKMEDPLYRIRHNLASQFGGYLKKRNFPKNSKAIKMLGCSFEEFIKYIESKFEPWMKWDNYSAL